MSSRNIEICLFSERSPTPNSIKLDIFSKRNNIQIGNKQDLQKSHENKKTNTHTFLMGPFGTAQENLGSLELETVGTGT